MYPDLSMSAIVNIFNASTNTWSHTNLTLARGGLAATTVQDRLALFAGGETTTGVYLDIVDIYNADAQTWTVAHLSLARVYMAATSSVVLFCITGCWFLWLAAVSSDNFLRSGLNHIARKFSPIWALTFFQRSAKGGEQATNGTSAAKAKTQTQTQQPQTQTIVSFWLLLLTLMFSFSAAAAQLVQQSVAQITPTRSQLASTSVGLKAFFAGGVGGNSNSQADIYATVNIFDASAGAKPWRVANLSIPRYALAATSVGSKAFFAVACEVDFLR